jgi:hypothetical protein
MINPALLKQLQNDGVKYVRWAYAGSDDEGGLVEIKLFNSEEVEVEDMNTYGCDPNGESRNSQIFGLGLKLLEDRSGFENNDGSYGWILLNSESGELRAFDHANQTGMNAEEFDNENFDRVIIFRNENWTEKNDDSNAVEVVVCIDDILDFYVLSDKQKLKFISFDRIQREDNQRDFFEAGGQIRCKVDGKCLRSLLTSIGVETATEYYYHSDDGMSSTPNDVLTELVLFFSDISEPATIFVSGWSDEFACNVMNAESVIELDPAPSELENE